MPYGLPYQLPYGAGHVGEGVLGHAVVVLLCNLAAVAKPCVQRRLANTLSTELVAPRRSTVHEWFCRPSDARAITDLAERCPKVGFGVSIPTDDILINL
jgi:hypothetical protein